MYQWVVFVHILAAMIWVGGMLFLALVLVPVLRRETAQARAAMMTVVGERFRTVGWVMIATLLITGVWNLKNRGFSWEAILMGDVLHGRWGQVLLIKLLLVTVLITSSAVHDFIVGPRSTRAALPPPAGDPGRAASLRRAASLIGRVNGLLALAVIWLAMALVRGLPWW